MTQEQEKQVAAVIAALDETRLVAKLNRPVQVRNMEIRKANVEVHKENQVRRKKAAAEQAALDKAADKQAAEELAASGKAKKVKRVKVKPKLLKTTRLLPYEHRVSASTKACLQRETSIRKKLEARTPQAWLDKILKLPPEIQTNIACIVWWDHFSSRLTSERWSHLDPWIKHLPVQTDPDEIQSSILEEALCSLGYSPYHARQRLTKENT